MPKKTKPRSQFDLVSILFAALLASVFLLGGGARDNLVSLIVLRPIGVLLFFASGLVVRGETIRQNRLLIGLALALPTLALLQLIPLPPSWWQSLPGRELIARSDASVGLGEVWRPLSLVPFRTWNSFWSGLLPVAALILALGLSPRHNGRLVLLLGIIVIVSLVLQVLQTIGGHANAFYLYRVTTYDAAVGIFANRNHQAMLIAIGFVVIAAAMRLYGSRGETRGTVALVSAALALLLIPCLVATGSRAGLALGGLGIFAGYFLLRTGTSFLPQTRLKPLQSWVILIAGAVSVALLATAILSVQTSPLARFYAASPVDDLRFSAWSVVADAIYRYFPFGSGLGTFIEVYNIHELNSALEPTYLNHAHNDYLEILLTAGLPGIAIVAAAAFALSRALLQSLRRDAPRRSETEAIMARLGAAIVVILLVGSIYDYPLRVPSLAALFAVGVSLAVGRRVTN